MKRNTRVGVSVVGLVALVLAACTPGPSSVPSGPKQVNFGYTKQLTDGPLFRLPERAKQFGIEVDLKQLPRYPDLLTALAHGDVDLSTLGYPQATQTVEQKLGNVKFISGFGTGGTTLTIHNDVKVSQWKDVEGKKIGIFPGGPGDLNFRASLAKNNVDVGKVDVVKMTAPGAPLFQAMRSREIDGFVGWEPFSATAKVDGYAYYAPLYLWDNDAGGVNQALAANTDWLAKNKDTAIMLLKLINEEMVNLTSDKEAWAKLTQQTLGIEAPIFQEAIKHFSLDVDLPFKLKEAQAMARYMGQYGMAQGDFSAQIPNVVTYEYLEKASGKTRQELGGGR